MVYSHACLCVYDMCIIQLQNDWTALHVACANNFVRIVYLLLRNGANPNTVIDKKVCYDYKYLLCYMRAGSGTYFGNRAKVGVLTLTGFHLGISSWGGSSRITFNSLI